MYQGIELWLTVTTQLNQGVNQPRSTNNYNSMPTPKGKFSPIPFSSSKPSKLPKLATLRCQEKVPYPLIYLSNKITPTKWNIYLGATYIVIEYSGDCGKIKVNWGHGNVKRMQKVQNTGAMIILWTLYQVIPNNTIYSFP